MTTIDEKIAALPEWPKEESYVTPMKLKSGIQITYSYPADEVRCLSDQLDAALARLALVREQLQAIVASHACEDDGTPPCSNCADARRVLEATK